MKNEKRQIFPWVVIVRVPSTRPGYFEVWGGHRNRARAEEDLAKFKNLYRRSSTEAFILFAPTTRVRGQILEKRVEPHRRFGRLYRVVREAKG